MQDPPVRGLVLIFELLHVKHLVSSDAALHVSQSAWQPNNISKYLSISNFKSTYENSGIQSIETHFGNFRHLLDLS